MRASDAPVDLPLFVHGTLLDAEFASNLLERPVEPVPATLLDFERPRIEGMPYPSVFERPGEVVDGKLYRGLEPADWERLDHYEGVGEGLYRRIVGRVVAEDGGSAEPAVVYVVTERTLRSFGAL